MPINPTRVLSIIRQIEEKSPDALKEVDRELLLWIRQTLQRHKQEVDNVRLRLAFIDEQQLSQPNCHHTRIERPPEHLLTA